MNIYVPIHIDTIDLHYQTDFTHAYALHKNTHMHTQIHTYTSIVVFIHIYLMSICIYKCSNYSKCKYIYVDRYTYTSLHKYTSKYRYECISVCKLWVVFCLFEREFSYIMKGCSCVYPLICELETIFCIVFFHFWCIGGCAFADVCVCVFMWLEDGIFSRSQYLKLLLSWIYFSVYVLILILVLNGLIVVWLVY